MRKKKLMLLLDVALFIFLLLGTVAIDNYAYAADKKVIRMLTDATGDTERKALTEIIQEYEKANPNIKINLELTGWQEIQTKVIAGIASGDPPEIMTAMYADAAQLEAMGALLPVEDIIDQLGRDDYMPGTIPNINGHEYIIPYYPFASALWYRSDLFEKKGLKPPRTWDQLLEAAKILTEDTDGDGKIDRWGYAMALGDKRWTPQNFVLYFWTNGGKLFGEDQNIAFDKEPYRNRMIETFKFYKELAKYTPPGSTDYAWWETMNAFATGKVAMNNYFFRQVDVVKKNGPELLPYTKATFHPFRMRIASMGGNSGCALLKNSKNLEEAKKFLLYFYSGDAYIKWLHALPGAHKPSRRSIFYSKKWLDIPVLQQHKDDLQVIMDSLEFATYWPDEWKIEKPGVIIPEAQALFNSPILVDMVKSVIVFNEDPAKAIDLAAKKSRALVEEQKKLRKK